MHVCMMALIIVKVLFCQFLFCYDYDFWAWVENKSWTSHDVFSKLRVPPVAEINEC